MNDAGVMVHTGWVPGLLGELVRWHGRYYVGALGWPPVFERIVAREASELAAAPDDEAQIWSAWRDGHFLGCIALDSREAATKGARLRFFIASDEARGHGVGTRLMRIALEAADARGDARVWLTTVRGLAAAAHLYSKFGFVLADEHDDDSWGASMREQRFVRERHAGSSAAVTASTTP
jgi:GNAT superfamily N-acetyltransferase